MGEGKWALGRKGGSPGMVRGSCGLQLVERKGWRWANMGRCQWWIDIVWGHEEIGQGSRMHGQCWIWGEGSVDKRRSGGKRGRWGLWRGGKERQERGALGLETGWVNLTINSWSWQVDGVMYVVIKRSQEHRRRKLGRMRLSGRVLWLGRDKRFKLLSI